MAESAHRSEFGDGNVVEVFATDIGFQVKHSKADAPSAKGVISGLKLPDFMAQDVATFEDANIHVATYRGNINLAVQRIEQWREHGFGHEGNDPPTSGGDKPASRKLPTPRGGSGFADWAGMNVPRKSRWP